MKPPLIRTPVIIYSDSQYVVNALEQGWLIKWQQKKFKKVKNTDLWIRFLKVYTLHKVKFKWIKGHAGHIENERCDELAVKAATSKNLKIDQGYEDNQE
jgi:ribonuclease HI